MVKIAVIGAGVVGVSTALNVQSLIPSCQVTIIADSFQKLTSYVAAGIFRPTSEFMEGVPPKTARKWVEESWKQYDKLAFSPEAAQIGVTLLSGYHLWDEGKAYTKAPILTDEFSYHFRMLSPKELDMFPGHRYQHGCFYTTLQIEPKKYLPWMTQRFVKGGGRILKKKVRNLKELYGEYDVVVNCTGMLANNLVHDPLLIPNRGQMFRVKAPWVKHFFYTNNDTWIVPCPGNVAIGGTRQYHDRTTDVRQHESDAMWARATSILPSIKDAEDVEALVGLRPMRKPLRLEAERIVFNNKELKVVHNYGHGGNGIGLSWGTAVNAAELVRELIGPLQQVPKAKY